MKSREVFQTGAELIGAGSRWADLEVLSLGARALEHLGRPLVIDLGHAAIASALMPEDADAGEVHRALAVKDARALEAIAPSMTPLVDLFGGAEILGRARQELGAVVAPAIDELEAIAVELSARLPEVKISFDLGEQRGLGYYTGIFFHGYVSGAADAVLMGGRYDGLLAKYGRSEPAIGLAIDVDAISRAREGARSGVVIAETDLDRPQLLAEAEKRRRAGERAVIVHAGVAHRHAIANGYRAIVMREDSGAIVERNVSENPDR